MRRASSFQSQHTNRDTLSRTTKVSFATWAAVRRRIESVLRMLGMNGGTADSTSSGRADSRRSSLLTTRRKLKHWQRRTAHNGNTSSGVSTERCHGCRQRRCRANGATYLAETLVGSVEHRLQSHTPHLHTRVRRRGTNTATRTRSIKWAGTRLDARGKLTGCAPRACTLIRSMSERSRPPLTHMGTARMAMGSHVEII